MNIRCGSQSKRETFFSILIYKNPTSHALCICSCFIFQALLMVLSLTSLITGFMLICCKEAGKRTYIQQIQTEQTQPTVNLLTSSSSMETTSSVDAVHGSDSPNRLYGRAGSLQPPIGFLPFRSSANHFSDSALDSQPRRNNPSRRLFSSNCSDSNALHLPMSRHINCTNYQSDSALHGRQPRSSGNGFDRRESERISEERTDGYQREWTNHTPHRSRGSTSGTTGKSTRLNNTPVTYSGTLSSEEYWL